MHGQISFYLRQSFACANENIRIVLIVNGAVVKTVLTFNLEDEKRIKKIENSKSLMLYSHGIKGIVIDYLLNINDNFFTAAKQHFTLLRTHDFHRCFLMTSRGNHKINTDSELIR